MTTHGSYGIENNKTRNSHKLGYFQFISEDIVEKWKGANNGNQDCTKNIWFTIELDFTINQRDSYNLSTGDSKVQLHITIVMVIWGIIPTLEVK